MTSDIVAAVRMVALLALCALGARAPQVEAQVKGPDAMSGRVTGVVTNLSPGGRVPVETTVVLYALDGEETVDVMEAMVMQDGSYSLEPVALVRGRRYIAIVEHQGVSYGSRIVTFTGSAELLSLPIDLYDATFDPSVIAISRLHIFAEFGSGLMRVSELYVFDNLSQRVFVGGTAAGSLFVPVPEGAMNPTVRRAMGDELVAAESSVLRTEIGFMDTLPVRPGTASQQLILTYDVSYPAEATVSHVVPYAVQALSLFVPHDGPEVDGGLFRRTPGGDLGLYARWDAPELPADAVLTFRIAGEPPGQTMTFRSVIDGSSRQPFSVAAGDNGVSWALGAGMLLTAIGAVLVTHYRRGTLASVATRENLLDAIVVLDQARDDGRIGGLRYRVGRERLKARLRAWY
jgi:hypothetical protein